MRSSLFVDLPPTKSPRGGGWEDVAILVLMLGLGGVFAWAAGIL